MLETSPSRTAFATTFLRAAHMQLDDQPAIIDDPVALQLLPWHLRAYLNRQAKFRLRWLKQLGRRDLAFTAMRSQIVVRARYAEDCLSDARQRGAARFVILGAGLDTFALRQPAPAVEVMEVDHPATQQWKLQLLNRRGFQLPTNLHFLPVDFEQATLSALWPRSASLDFISWLGVSYYLTRESILITLADLAQCTLVGSELVLDYWTQPPMNIDGPLLWGTRLAVALQGEPMRSLFEPDEIEALVTAAGWQVKDHLSPAQQNQRYLANRKDGLKVPSFAHLLRIQNPQSDGAR